MDISQYRPDLINGSRDTARESYATTQQRAKAPPHPTSSGGAATQDEGFSLFDVALDSVNPLQHIPGVSTVYQKTTGDDSSALANMAGGFLFGGPIGMAAGAAKSFLELMTGQDLGDHAMALFGDGTESEGLIHIAHEQGGGGESLLSMHALGVEHYQAFAQAKDAKNIGYGAKEQDVGWTSNIWTNNALKEAAGLYENNDSLGEQPSTQQSQHANDLV